MARNNNKTLGFALIIAGSLGLLLLALFLTRPLWADLFGQAGKKGVNTEAGADATDADATEENTMTIPVPTGSSELQDYYATHPRTEPKDVVIKEEDEGYEYYTRPDGSHWKKDSNSADIVGDAKKGTSSYRQEIAGVPSSYATNLHVEFWESSVGFTGYQMKGNNLYLYGINPDDTLRFERHDNGVWMFHKRKIYLLKETGRDMPFVEVDPKS